MGYLDHKEWWMPKNWAFWTVVLEKILESPLYKKEIKPVNLKGNQLVTPAVSAEASTEGLQVERTDASTVKVPNHGRSKQTVCSPTYGEAQKGWRLWRRGMAQGSTRATTYQVGLERTEQAYVAETWWLGVGQNGTSSPWSTAPKLLWRRSPVISSSEMGWREYISLPLIIPLNEEVVELVGHHKLFHGLDYLPIAILGAVSPQLQSYSSGGNWQSCVLLGQGHKMM